MSENLATWRFENDSVRILAGALSNVAVLRSGLKENAGVLPPILLGSTHTRSPDENPTPTPAPWPRVFRQLLPHGPPAGSDDDEAILQVPA